MTINKDTIIAQLKDQNQNLAYENQRMADFIETLGVNQDDLVDYVINGGEQEVKMMIDHVILCNRKQDITILFPSHCADKRANE